MDHVALEVEPAPVAGAGDHVLVRDVAGDAPEVGADGRKRVDAPGAADDVGALLAVEANGPLGEVERAAREEARRRLEQNLGLEVVERHQSRTGGRHGAGPDADLRQEVAPARFIGACRARRERQTRRPPSLEALHGDGPARASRRAQAAADAGLLVLDDDRAAATCPSTRIGASSSAASGSRPHRATGTISMQSSGQTSWHPPHSRHSVPSSGVLLEDRVGPAVEAARALEPRLALAEALLDLGDPDAPRDRARRGLLPGMPRSRGPARRGRAPRSRPRSSARDGAARGRTRRSSAPRACRPRPR